MENAKKLNLPKKRLLLIKNNPIILYLTSYDRLVSIYQVLIFILAVVATFVLNYQLNLKILSRGTGSLILYGIVAFAIISYLCTIISQVKKVISTLNIYWIWFSIYALIIGLYLGVNTYFTIKKVVISPSDLILLVYIHIIIKMSLTCLFQLWFYKFEGAANPIIKNSCFYKNVIWIFNMLVITISFLIYRLDVYKDFLNVFQNTWILVCLGIVAGLVLILYLIAWFFYFSWTSKFNLLSFKNLSNYHTLTLAGMFAISFWYIFFNVLTNLAISKWDYLCIGLDSAILIIYTLLMLKGKNELKSNLSRNTLLVGALTLVWISLFIFRTVIHNIDNIYYSLGYTGFCTCIIIIIWYIFKVEVKGWINFFISIICFLISGALTSFAFLDYYNLFKIAQFFNVSDLFCILIIFIELLTITFLSLKWYSSISNVNKFQKNVKRGE